MAFCFSQVFQFIIFFFCNFVQFIKGHPVLKIFENYFSGVNDATATKANNIIIADVICTIDAGMNSLFLVHKNTLLSNHV